MAKHQWKVGDRVYIKLDNGQPGRTMYELTQVADTGFACMIREVSGDGRQYAAQRWDTTLLFKAGPQLLAKRFF